MPRLARMPKKEPVKPKHSSIKTSTLMAMSVALAFASLGLMVTSAGVTPLKHVVKSFTETTRSIVSTYSYNEGKRVPVSRRLVAPNEVDRGTSLRFLVASTSSTVGADARVAFVPIEFTKSQASPNGAMGPNTNRPSTDSLYRSYINRTPSLWGTSYSFDWTAPLTSAPNASDYVDVVVYTGILQRTTSGQPKNVRLDDYSIIRFKLVSNLPKVGVVKNSTFVDGTAANPNGFPSQTVKIGSFVITGLQEEPVDITQIVLKDPSTVLRLGDNFENLFITQELGHRFGLEVATLNTSATQATYVFNYIPTSATPTFRIAQGGRAIIDVFARVKATPRDPEKVLNPSAIVDAVVAVGANTQSDVSNSNDLPLQSAFILSRGNLVVSVNSATPQPSQLVMGSVQVPLATFNLAASGEAINVSKLVLTNMLTMGATGTIKNLKLFTTDSAPRQIGATAQLRAQAQGMPYVEFSGLNIYVGKDTTYSFVVKGDVASYDDGAISGSTHQFVLKAGDYDATTAGVQSSVTARGSYSGAAIENNYLDFGGETDGDLVGNTMTVYRAKLTARYAGDSPSGAASGSLEQTVATIILGNVSNSGAYDLIVKNVDFTLAGNGLDTSRARAIKVYKESLTPANLLASTYMTLGSGVSGFEVGGQNFIDTTISSGRTVPFKVTVDTSDASADDRISFSVVQGQITWSDGRSTSIRMVDDLPLTSKVFTY